MGQLQDSIQGQWATVCAQLREASGDRFADRWLSKIVPDKIENNQVSLCVPSPCIHELVKQNYADQILMLWKTQNPDIGVLNLRLTHAEAAQSPAPLAAPRIERLESAVPAYAPAFSADEDEALPALLDASHTFETFVVGKSNQFAYAAARKMAEEETLSFNPLYIHGGVGLGKTHLMHAIAWKMKEAFPDKTVLYLSSEQFLHRFIKSLRANSTERFRELFRSVDVLMIDDIQFIFGKKATQEEFFHTFNALVAQGKKIILSADSSPHDLRSIEERLKTRIAQGLVVDIHPTCYELRLGILQEKVAQLNAVVPPDVLEFLAKNVTSNVRELEGALKRIVAHAGLVGGRISIETTRVVLKDILSVYDKQASVPEIQRAVGAYYRLPLVDLISSRRERKIARPRQLAMYLSKLLTPLSLPDIAAHFKRDHTTVIHAVRTIEDLLPRDDALRADAERLTTQIREGNYA